MTMRTRLFILTALIAALAIPSPSNAQPAASTNPPSGRGPRPAPAAAPDTAAVTTTTTVVTAPSDLTMKDMPSTPVAKSSGQNTLSVDFADEEIRNILRNVAEL